MRRWVAGILRPEAVLNHEPDRELEKRQDRRPRRGSDADEFWNGIGVDVEKLSPRAQVVTSLAVLVPVVLGLALVFTQFPWLWWLVFVFGWSVFPASSLLVRGVAGLSDGGGREAIGGNGKERELLGVLREHEEITPTQAAMETSLTVEEADGMLRELAAKGHLDVRVRGGGIFYGLWRAEDPEERGLEEGG
jgi:hypothetical protein